MIVKVDAERWRVAGQSAMYIRSVKAILPVGDGHMVQIVTANDHRHWPLGPLDFEVSVVLSIPEETPEDCIA